MLSRAWQRDVKTKLRVWVVAARYPSLEHLPLLLLSTNHRPWLEIDTRL